MMFFLHRTSMLAYFIKSKFYLPHSKKETSKKELQMWYSAICQPQFKDTLPILEAKKLKSFTQVLMCAFIKGENGKAEMSMQIPVCRIRVQNSHALMLLHHKCPRE